MAPIISQKMHLISIGLQCADHLLVGWISPHPCELTTPQISPLILWKELAISRCSCSISNQQNVCLILNYKFLQRCYRTPRPNVNNCIELVTYNGLILTGNRYTWLIHPQLDFCKMESPSNGTQKMTDGLELLRLAYFVVGMYLLVQHQVLDQD